MRPLRHAALATLACTASVLAQDTGAVTILARELVHEDVSARITGGHLWLRIADLEAITGFTRKPEGLCLDELCIPVPPDAGWERDIDGEPHLDLSAFAAHIDQPLVRDDEHPVWSLGRAPVLRARGLESGLAPDFALPDVSGKQIRLSDFRGRKVLLWTWASW